MAQKFMNDKRSGWWALAWIPVLLIFSFSGWMSDTISLGGKYALIPLAAWIGSTYGTKGFLAVLIGGLLLPIGLSLGPFYSGMHLDIYLISLLVCRLAASKRPLQERLTGFDSKRLIMAAFILLPLKVVFYHGEPIDGLPLSLGFDLYSLFMFWLFAAGAAGMRSKPLLIGLAAAAVIGTVLDLNSWPPAADALLNARRVYLPFLGLSDLNWMGIEYGFASPLDWLTGAGYFWSGQFLRRVWERGSGKLPLPWTACGWIALASLLALGTWDSYFLIRVLDWPKYALFNLMGSTPAMILVSLMAGVLLGRRGILLMTGLLVLFWVLNGLVWSGFDLARPYIIFRLQEILYAFGFGALGVRLRDKALGQETFLFDPRWIWYGLLIGALAFLVLIGKYPLGQKFFLAGVFMATAGLAALSGYLRRKLTAWQTKGHQGWVSLLGVIMLAWMAWQHTGEIAAAIRKAHDLLGALTALPLHDLSRELGGGLIFSVFLVLVSIWIFLAVLQSLSQNLPDLIKDLKRLWFGLKSVIKGNGKRLAEFVPPKKPGPDRSSRVMDRVILCGRFLSRGLLVLALALPLALFVINASSERGFWSKIKNLYEDLTQPRQVFIEIPPECRGNSANPVLWQAAMEYIGDNPLVEAEPCGYSGKIETDWYISSEAPLQRTQLRLSIGQKLKKSSLRVFIDQQEKRLGIIWVEIENDAAAKNRIRQHIFSRAEGLSD